MFRIRRVYDAVLAVDRGAIAEVQAILRAQFPGVRDEDSEHLADKLHDPVRYRFRSILFVAQGFDGKVRGFALLHHEAQLRFCYLDFISMATGRTGTGLGGVLYERVREEALALGGLGLFFECLPDEPALCRDPAALAQNRARLRFYERFGARPVVGTAYETPLQPGGDQPPYLVHDNLGRQRPLRAAELRSMVEAVLERKYADICPPEYVQLVLDSIVDDPVRLRPPRYTDVEAVEVPDVVPLDRRIPLVVNDKHEIHHVRERGYVQSPVRVSAIRRELDKTNLFRDLAPAKFADKHVTAVHDRGFVRYLERICGGLESHRSVYPYVFPLRNIHRPPKDLAIRAGYYCIDTFTPLHRNAWLAARRGVDCALTAARCLLEGERLAYALVRPPGHHAERRSFGGFCYLNQAAIAAEMLSKTGKVAILDVDYHHGNGQQDIFWERADVLTVSIHGHPSFAYPYFSGFAEEQGSGDGRGCNVNLPLAEQIDGVAYRRALGRALRRIDAFDPMFLVVCLGLDTARGDPTGTWTLGARDFERNGKMIGALRLPTVVIQEGGYKTRVLGLNARYFFQGLWRGAYAEP